MAFLYVDRITDYQDEKFIRGLKHVTRNEPFFYWLPNGRRVLSPAVVLEAMAQLGAWLKMKSTDFKYRPVLLCGDRVEYFDVPEAGDTIEIVNEVVDFQEDVITLNGEAYIDGKLIIRSETSRGYLLPMDDFDCSVKLSRNFDRLFKSKHTTIIPRSEKLLSLKSVCGAGSFDALRLLDGIIDHTPYKEVVAFKNFSSCESFFNEHFVRRPVVPGVMLITFVGEVCQYLLRQELEFPLRERALIPTYISHTRFRKFVEPGDQAVVQVKVIEGDASKPNEHIRVKAIMKVGNQRVMQSEMGFETMFASHLSNECNRYKISDKGDTLCPKELLKEKWLSSPVAPEA